MDDAAPLYHAVGADHFGHRHDRRDLGHGNTRFFEFGRDRSAAASGRASSGGENDRRHPFGFEFLRDFTT